MQYKIYWYSVQFPNGEVRTIVVDDTCDTVQFQYENSYFESEAYHLATWCKEFNYELQSGELIVTLPIKPFEVTNGTIR